MTREELIKEYVLPACRNTWNDKICKEIEKALEQEPCGQKWISVSEGLPKEREWYLAVFKEVDTGFQLIPRVADYIGGEKNEWRLIDEDGLVKEYRDTMKCVAWMPLPQPYKADKED